MMLSLLFVSKVAGTDTILIFGKNGFTTLTLLPNSFENRFFISSMLSLCLKFITKLPLSVVDVLRTVAVDFLSSSILKMRDSNFSAVDLSGLLFAIGYLMLFSNYVYF